MASKTGFQGSRVASGQKPIWDNKQYGKHRETPWGYSEHPRSIKKMGALKAPKVSKIERIVCWCHFTRLPKQNKVSYFKIFKVIKKKAEKTLFLFRIAPPHPIRRKRFNEK